MFRTLTWLHTNRKQVTTGAIIAAVVALAIGAYTWKKSAADSTADSQLMNLPSAPGVSTPMGSVPATSYLDIARQYPSTPAGTDAQLLGAETLFLEGNYSQAEQEYNQFLNEHPESDLLPQAMMGVAASLEAEGKIPEAMRKYQEIISGYAGDPGIVEPAKLTMARLSEANGKYDQALSYYAELARNQSPYDPWAGEARERAVLLLSHHPELRQQVENAAPSASSFSSAPTGSFAPGPPLRRNVAPSGAPVRQPAPAAAPAAPTQTGSPGINFLNVPSKPAKQ